MPFGLAIGGSIENMRWSLVLRSYQRGAWSPGSKHQKHMSLNPTHYLYRFPGPKGPGPFTMKYWWSLGCFPTGLNTPFRLHEFLQAYQQQHVPIEVEEWLQYVVKDPMEELMQCISCLHKCFEEYPSLESSQEFKIDHISGHSFTNALEKMERCLGISLGAPVVRKTLCFPDLRERVLDDLEDYRDYISINGSTPHRRAARLFLDDPCSESSNSLLCNSSMTSGCNLPENISNGIGVISNPPDHTTYDEVKLIRLLTTFAEGGIRGKLVENGKNAVASSLQFAHDSESQSVVHANMSIAAIENGEFKEAEYHARESLLCAQTAPLKKSKKSYILWATSVAYQDDFSRSETILNEAISLFPDDSHLQDLLKQVSYFKGSEKYLAGIGEAVNTSSIHAVQSKKLLTAIGRTFDNEFSWIAFRSKIYPAKMNPSSNELGSVFRRIGDLGLHTSSSRSSELL